MEVAETSRGSKEESHDKKTEERWPDGRSPQAPRGMGGGAVHSRKRRVARGWQSGQDAGREESSEMLMKRESRAPLEDA
jgi:hypothetical protein